MGRIRELHTFRYFEFILAKRPGDACNRRWRPANYSIFRHTAGTATRSTDVGTGYRSNSGHRTIFCDANRISPSVEEYVYGPRQWTFRTLVEVLRSCAF